VQPPQLRVVPHANHPLHCIIDIFIVIIVWRAIVIEMRFAQIENEGHLVLWRLELGQLCGK
jgi:hypothetical protein